MRPALTQDRRRAAVRPAEVSPTVHDHRLSRRTMLRASGYGALALSLPTAITAVAAPAASAAAAAPAALRRASYLGLVGETFTVAGGPSVTLSAVTDIAGAKRDASLAGRDDAFVLTFTAPAGAALGSGILDLQHPDLGRATLFLSPVDVAEARHLEAVIDRTVTLASALDDAPSPQTAAAIAIATSSDPDAAGRPAARAALPAVARLTAQRLRVSASAKRSGSHLTANLHFPTTGVKAVEVRLVAHGRTYATGTAVVRQHRAHVTLKAGHRVARGKYQLVITATKRDRTSQTVARTVTIR